MSSEGRVSGAPGVGTVLPRAGRRIVGPRQNPRGGRIAPKLASMFFYFRDDMLTYVRAFGRLSISRNRTAGESLPS